MTDKETIEVILKKLWKSDCEDNSEIYNIALQDVQTAIDSIQEEPKPKFKEGDIIRPSNYGYDKFEVLSISTSKHEYWLKDCLTEGAECSLSFDYQDEWELVEDPEELTHSEVTKMSDQEEQNLNHEIEVYFQFWWDNESGGVVKPDNWLAQMEDLHAVARHFASWQKQNDKEQILILTDQIESCHAAMKCKDELMEIKLHEQKEEMMKDAIDGYVDQVEYPDLTLIQLSENPKDLKDGDKVKLIIIKEE